MSLVIFSSISIRIKNNYNLLVDDLVVNSAGAYDTEEAAARAYDLAALKYWGPETTLNFTVCCSPLGNRKSNALI